MERSYRYLGYFFLLLIPLIIAGFYRYIAQFPTFENVKFTFIHVHAAIASVWVALIIVQPFLIVNKKMEWHRVVGKLSYFIFPLLILSFFPSIMNNLNADTGKLAFFPIGDGILLTIFYGLAIGYRKQSSLHMRYMIAAALVLLGPTVGRILPQIFEFSDLATQNIQYGIIQSVLIALVILDFKTKRDYSPYLVAIGGWLLHQFAFYWIFVWS